VPSFTSTGEYFDVAVAARSAFSSLGIDVCAADVGTALYWWDPATKTWGAVSPVSKPSGIPPCLAATLSSTSTPDLAELTGTVFAVGTPVTPPARSVTVVYGPTADATAAAELTRAFAYEKGSCPPARDAVVATTKEYQDALASQYLAQDLATGTLLTPSTSLARVTATTLRKEGVKTVYIVGGPLAVTRAVANEIGQLTAYECGGASRGRSTGKIVVHRIYGKNQYATAMKVAELVGPGAAKAFPGAYTTTNTTGGTGRYNDTAGTGSAAPRGAVPTAILASGQEFQDAQSASVLSYRTKLPLLLTPASTLSSTAVAAIEKLHVQQVILMGGPLAVSDTVEAALVAETGVSVLRVAGKDYTDTARELARFEAAAAPEGLGWTFGHRVMVARGNGFTDGLAGAVLDSPFNTATGPEDTVRPLLLTRSPASVGASLSTFLRGIGDRGRSAGTTATEVVTALTVLGGPKAVPMAEIAAMETDLRP
jgi:putative cell wall-binding protein